MIAARLHDDNGGTIIMLVLEPGNFEKLKLGLPIHKFLNEFMPELRSNIELVFTYTPDIEWVTENVLPDGSNLTELITESLS